MVLEALITSLPDYARVLRMSSLPAVVLQIALVEWTIHPCTREESCQSICALSNQSELVYPKPSGIHGHGLFARLGIPAEERIIEYRGERISKAESLKRCETNNQYIFALDAETDLDGNNESNLARWINHSCDPNSEAQLIDGHIWIIALREISAGEEITFNYGYDLASYREHPCHCGASSCVGFIVAEVFFSEVLALDSKPGLE